MGSVMPAQSGWRVSSISRGGFLRFFGSPCSAIDLTLLAKRILSGFSGFFAGHSQSDAAQGRLSHNRWRRSWIRWILWPPNQRKPFGAPSGVDPIWILGILCRTSLPGTDSPWGSKNPKYPKNLTFDLLPRSPALQRGPKNPTNLVYHVRFR